MAEPDLNTSAQDSRQNGINPVPMEEDAITTKSSKHIEGDATTLTASKSTSPVASLVRTFTDRALSFLSTASNETLGACLVGLGASTYLVLGRIGLVIIGVAGGVVLHATWADIRGDDRDEAIKKAEQERRREAGIEVAKRLLEWNSQSQSDKKSSDSVKIYAGQELDFAASFGPEATTALNTFTDAVIKDYVHYWYEYTIPSEKTFPASCRRTFMAFVLSLTGHLQRQRPADAFTTFLTNASSWVIVFLHELSLALNASPNTPPEEAVATYLKSKPDCSLSFMLDQSAQKKKLSEVSETILQDYLDVKLYNCPPVHLFLKEVFSQLVLGYTLELCSKPEWINDWIVYGLEESETTKEVMEIVDAGVEGRAEKDVPKAVERINEQTAAPTLSNEANADATPGHRTDHKRTMSRAEEAMDEAMREAQRLTEMMIEEDRRKAEEEEKRRSVTISQDESSDETTHSGPIPASSQSDQERQEEDSMNTTESPLIVQDKPTTPSTQFTNFEQLVPTAQPTALTESPVTAPSRSQSAVLTLQNANVSIFDDSTPGEKASLKAKPQTDYNILIEPASAAFGGWMVIRKYSDFETLHEVLRRISVITGARFNEYHSELPKWKTHTKASLRSELERYICDAMGYQSLAESEGMKRFLEKDKGMSKSPSGSNKGFGWPTPDAFGKLGGDMMSVLTKAPKQVAGGVAGGGKAVFGGVAGLVGGNKRPNGSPTTLSRSTASFGSDDVHTSESPVKQSAADEQSFVTDPTTGSFYGTVSSARESQESFRASSQTSSDPRRTSTMSLSSLDAKAKPSAPPSRPASIRHQREPTQTYEAPLNGSVAEVATSKLSFEETVNLPPPPSEMPPDYGGPSSPIRKSADTSQSSAIDERISPSLAREKEPPAKLARPQRKIEPKVPISERETAVAVELMFAVINELYTMSGAWGIRKTFLNAAKTYLLRPGNPQLLSIRDLLQTSLLDSNLNDAGLAHHIYKLRENTLPTAEELEAWKRDYPEKSPEQKEELRIKARKLLVTKGMPQALTSVMGAAASGEALGKVFDCLQVPEISRALIFGLMLQATRVVV